MLCTRKQWKIY